MPRISEFFGIIVYMYWMDIQKHRKPHFHVRFKGNEAVFDLSGKCLTGNVGDRANHLISEWCAENRKAIKQAWECAVNGKEIPWVRPLQ